eukprot:TRINITY_DN55181_c0_g1_i1.p1 TRINITY_DN55181_c0_g1~~TRINITY_DN55181_c0_g1_i1.p1  ORF type:complete len:529 (-),score=66.45 TRINITY_DN55181_c0_g1_i1:11-1597(-)
MKRSLCHGYCVATLVATCVGQLADGRSPNILYLIADDMRPQLGSYGQSYMRTPHLDQLSATGLHFDFAYTNFAYCAPSRNSFLSGRRPDRTRAVNFLTTFRGAPDGQKWTSMPEFFKKHGYFTSSAGKLYHDGMDDERSWSYPSNQTKWIHCQNGDAHVDEHENVCGITKDSAIPYSDEDLALAEGLKRLDLAKSSGKPWFVGFGLHRPHWQYRTPPGFYGHELYPHVKPPEHPDAPEDAPYMSGDWAGGDIKDPAHGCRECVVPNYRANMYRRWYYAAVTYSDHILGQVMAKLDDMKETNKTIVVFHSDHGYQLGELNEWSKKTNTELATHVPLMIRVPWKETSVGKRTAVRAELVDVYRTLADLTGLGEDIEESVQGTSLAALFDDPSKPSNFLNNKIAYSQIPRCGCNRWHKHNSTECGLGVCVHTPVHSPAFNFMGYSMRTAEWRYTAWVPWDHAKASAVWPSLDMAGAVELYDLRGDDGRNFDFTGYSKNLAQLDEYKNLVAKFHEELRLAVNGWHSSEVYVV